MDDEPQVCSAVRRELRKRFIVKAHTDPEAFMREARKREHDILLIDWNLRTCEGTDLCAELRGEGDTRPIGLFSGKLETHHAVELAKKHGANDFIAKSEPKTWAPKLEALLRKPTEPPLRTTSGVIELAGNRVMLERYTANLTDKERAVFEVLADADGAFVSREEIARRVWGRHREPSTTLVDNVISRLRDHLGDERDLIESGPDGWRLRVPVVKKSVKKR